MQADVLFWKAAGGRLLAADPTSISASRGGEGSPWGAVRCRRYQPLVRHLREQLLGIATRQTDCKPTITRRECMFLFIFCPVIPVIRRHGSDRCKRASHLTLLEGDLDQRALLLIHTSCPTVYYCSSAHGAGHSFVGGSGNAVFNNLHGVVLRPARAPSCRQAASRAWNHLLPVLSMSCKSWAGCFWSTRLALSSGC